MPVIKKKSKLPVSVKGNDTLVLMDSDGYPHIEIRPTYNKGIGPAVQFYRIGITGDGEHLVTLRLVVVGAMVQKLPIVIAAARRLANGSTKPNVKPDSSSA